MNVTITDRTNRSASQVVTVHINDVNEAPELRQPDNATQKSEAHPAVYKRFLVKEDAQPNVELGELKAWDPDETSVLLFTLEGPENTPPGQPGAAIFSVRRTDDRFSAGAGSTGRVTVAVLELRHAEVLDYETKQMYTLELVVSDGIMQDKARVEIEIVNVNDVTVDDVVVLSTGARKLVTDGGERVRITGTNFGVKFGDNQALEPEVRVTYGRLDKDRDTQWFAAAGCGVVNAGIENTAIECFSEAGFGALHVWKVEVFRVVLSDSGSRELVSDGFADSSTTTEYAPPVITSIQLAKGGAPATRLSTRGGTIVKLSGTNFGAKGLALEAYYTSNPSSGWYCAHDCVVTVDNREQLHHCARNRVLWCGKWEKLIMGGSEPFNNFDSHHIYAPKHYGCRKLQILRAWRECSWTQNKENSPPTETRMCI